jgi:hypothetical protein
MRRTKMKDESLQEMVQQTAKLVNNMGFDYTEGSEIIAKALIKEHRTLQQSIIRLLAGSIAKYAELSFHDPRNESAVEWAKKVAEIENYFPHI